MSLKLDSLTHIMQLRLLGVKPAEIKVQKWQMCVNDTETGRNAVHVVGVLGGWVECKFFHQRCLFGLCVRVVYVYKYMYHDSNICKFDKATTQQSNITPEIAGYE